MKLYQLLGLAGGLLILSSCSSARSGWYRERGFRPYARVSLQVRNVMGLGRENVPVVIKKSELPPLLQTAENIQLVDTYAGAEAKGGHAGASIVSQLDDLDGDGQWDELAFQVNLEALEQKYFHLYAHRVKGDGHSLPSGVRAKVAKTPRITYLALESDRIAYFIYDAAVLDVIGKQRSIFSIDHFFDRRIRILRSPNSSEFGADFMPVGRTFGAGSVCLIEDASKPALFTRPWTTNSLFYSESDLKAGGAKFDFKVVAAGPVRAIGRSTITNWESEFGRYECQMTYTMWSNRREIKTDVQFTRMESRKKPPVMAIGFRKIAGEITFKATPSFAYAVSKDVRSRTISGTMTNLVGLSLIYDRRDFDRSLDVGEEDSQDHLLLLKQPGRMSASFYCFAGWDRDALVQSKDEWDYAVRELAERLYKPPVSHIDSLEH